MKPTKELLASIKFKVLEDTIALEDISDEEYFSKKYENYVSNSSLKRIDPTDGGSPKAYFEGTPKLFTESLVFGSAVHELVLQPDNFFLVEDIIVPAGKVGLIAELCYNSSGKLPDDNYILNQCKLVDYYNGLPSKNTLDKLKKQIESYIKAKAEFNAEYWGSRVGLGHPSPLYLNQQNLDRIHGCIDSLSNNKEAQSLLHPKDIMDNELPNGNEKTILVDVEASIEGVTPVILHLKSKLDNYSIDETSNIITVNDVKTTSSMDYFNSAIKKYRYYREMGMYSWMLSKCANKLFNLTNPSITSNFLTVETKPDFTSKVVKCTPQMIISGVKEFIYLLRLVAWYSIMGYEK